MNKRLVNIECVYADITQVIDGRCEYEITNPGFGVAVALCIEMGTVHIANVGNSRSVRLKEVVQEMLTDKIADFRRQSFHAILRMKDGRKMKCVFDEVMDALYDDDLVGNLELVFLRALDLGDAKPSDQVRYMEELKLPTLKLEPIPDVEEFAERGGVALVDQYRESGALDMINGYHIPAPLD